MNKYVWAGLVFLAAALAVAAANLGDPWNWICGALIAGLAAIGVPSATHVFGDKSDA